MSYTNEFCVSVKDYAEQRGKTVQAVYQQMKRKENSQQLDGHVFTKRVGNRDVKFLDEEAVLILDKASNSAPLMMLQDDLKSDLEDARKEAESWKAQALMLQGKIDLLKEQLNEKDDKLFQLAAPEEHIKALEAEKSRLSDDVAQRDKTIAKCEDALAEANKKIEALESRTLADYLKGWFRKKKE